MTIRVVPDAAPVGRGARRVRADERHPRPEAGAGSVARVRGRAAAHHGQRAGARVVHRPRLPLPLPQPPQRGMAGREPQGAHRPHGRRRRRRRARSRSCSRCSTACCNGETVSTEQLLAQPDGEQRWESIHYAPNRDAEGNVIGIYAVHTDIHDQKRNEDALRRANWMLSSHINNTPLAVLEWDRDFRLVRWSPQAENIFGWRRRRSARHAAHRQPAAARGRPRGGRRARRQADERRGAARDRPHAQPPQGRRARSGASGTTRRCSTTTARSCRSCRSCRTCRSRIQAEERLQYLATRDALTGLPNRLLLHERLTQAIAQAKRSGRRVGVLFIDLDRFKNVNDTLGHRIGDELLKHVTRGAVRRAARDRPAGAARRRRVHGDRRGLRRAARCSAASRRSCSTRSRSRSRSRSTTST